MKPIITVPHPTLRQKSKPVTEVTGELVQLIDDLEDSLLKKRNPKGVGLSAPQIDAKLAVFSTLLSEDGERDGKTVLHSYINPRIIKHSKDKTFGPDPENPILEGCLSIPYIYGPVPRYGWLELEFEIIENDQLKTVSHSYQDFFARVIQHELDHLHGILFTDYSLEFDLPIYEEINKKMELIDKSKIKY